MVEDQTAWQFEHSVDCSVAMEFAWNFWTTVGNWALDADIETVELEGPFAAGTPGITKTKTFGDVRWRIAEVQLGRAVIEFPLAGALGRFVWTFEDTGGRTRITQRCTIHGDRAASYAEAFGPTLEGGIPPGMQALCRAMGKGAKGN